MYHSCTSSAGTAGTIRSKKRRSRIRIACFIIS
jgi:hypothetical protein